VCHHKKIRGIGNKGFINFRPYGATPIIMTSYFIVVIIVVRIETNTSYIGNKDYKDQNDIHFGSIIALLAEKRFPLNPSY
jgi:hypothetical protein